MGNGNDFETITPAPASPDANRGGGRISENLAANFQFIAISADSRLMFFFV